MLINMKTTTQRSLRFHLVLLTALVSGGIAWADDLSTMVAKRHPVDLTLPFEATVEAMTQTTLTSQVSGRVIDMRVDVGQPVRKGDLLLRIDAREASEMAAGATAQYINAKANYDRLKNLHQQKFISAAALDKAKADFEAAQAARLIRATPGPRFPASISRGPLRKGRPFCWGQRARLRVRLIRPPPGTRLDEPGRMRSMP